MDGLLTHAGEMIEIIGEKFFLLGFISGFLYGAWVAWSLSGRADRVR
jgi:hypothetical protein